MQIYAENNYCMFSNSVNSKQRIIFKLRLEGWRIQSFTVICIENELHYKIKLQKKTVFFCPLLLASMEQKYLKERKVITGENTQKKYKQVLSQ